MQVINLMQGDCLELMKNIPDGSVDLILTDPPYNIARKNNFHTMGRVGIELDENYFNIAKNRIEDID